MPKLSKNKFGFLPLFFLITSLFLLSGCSPQEAGGAIKDKLRDLNRGLGEEFNNFNKEEKDSVMDFFQKKKKEGGESDRAEESSPKEKAKELSPEEKEKIDAWLEEKGLNKYGDSQGVYYPHGTPLVDPETGEKIGRYEYILQRYPNILNK